MEKYHRYSLEDSEEQRIDLHKKLPKPWNGIIICQLSVSPDLWARILAGSLMRMKMHFIQVRHFQREQMDKEPETEVLLIEKDGEELEQQGNQTVQELEALAIAQRIQKLSVSKRCWIRIAELIVRQDMVILSSFCELLRDGRSHSARYLHQRESRSIQHLEQDILQHRKW